MKKSVAVLMLVMMAVGFDWGFAQTNRNIVQITVKNQFPIPVVIQVDQTYVGNVEANSSIKFRTNITKGPLKIDVWGYENPKIIATKTFDTLAPGKDIVWATGNVELSAQSAPVPPKVEAASSVPAPAKTVVAPAPAKTLPAPVQAKPVAPPSQTPALPAAAKDSRVTYMKSASTLSYKGQKTQNRVKTASLAKIDRKRTSNGFTYDLSGDGAVMVGKASEASFYGISPIKVNRSSADRLSSDRKALSPWLEVVNRTLNGLTHKRMTSGAWEEPIALSLGDTFPGTFQARFRARPLPEPDSKWTLITADSGLISFRPLDEEYQETLVYGRYQGVLVYAPADGDFLQAAAAFTLYHGEDQFRIEQIHFAADADGNQLYPALDVGPFLSFAPTDPAITTQGAFPSWCIQAAHELDFVHLAIMTAAEGSTNSPPMLSIANSSQNLINSSFKMAQQVLGNAGAQDFLGKWNAITLKAIASAQGIESWSFWLRNVVSIDLSQNFAMEGRMSPGNWWVDINKPLYVAAKKMINGKLYDIKLINDFPYATPTQTTIPVTPPQPTTPKPAIQQGPPDEVKEAPAADGGDAALWGLLGALGAGAGAYELGLFGGGSSDSSASDECKSQYKQCSNSGIEVSGFWISLSCKCPSGTVDYTQSGESYRYCSGCYKPLGSTNLRSTTRIKR